MDLLFNAAATREKLQSEVRYPSNRTSVGRNQLQHCAWSEHPLGRGLHHDRQMAHERQHETRDQPHVMVKRKPAVNTVFFTHFERRDKVRQLSQYGVVGEGDAFLQTGRAR
jgi:hypothetical protein